MTDSRSNQYEPYGCRENAIEEYKSLRKEIMDSQKQRVNLLTGSLAFIGAILAYLIKDGSLAQMESAALIILTVAPTMYSYSTRVREHRLSAFMHTFLSSITPWSSIAYRRDAPHLKFLQRASTSMIFGLVLIDIVLLYIPLHAGQRDYVFMSIGLAGVLFNFVLCLFCTKLPHFNEQFMTMKKNLLIERQQAQSRPEMHDEQVVGIAFDLEGTLIDLERLHHRSHLLAARDLGFHITYRRALRNINHFVGGPDQKVAEEIYALSQGKVRVKEFLRKKEVHFLKLFDGVKSVRPRKGFMTVLTDLANRKIKYTIGSNSTRDFTLTLLERSGLKQFFDADKIVTLNELDSPKPSAEVYKKTARLLKIKPSQQLVFEDSLLGVQAAMKAGSRVIAMPVVRDRLLADRLSRMGTVAVLHGWRDRNLARLLDILLCNHKTRL